ncbi:MAG TPA: Verru_Chthon cassette protein D [Chthoniobacteraceae bacterium]|nr:Verru_Chthon cassette protein D [Chthoniobacteraceae bacterium]
MNIAASRRRAFSLIELIIVISVIVIIAAFTMPAMNTILRGSNMTQASGLIVGQLSIARQQALSRNRPVEVRFYRFADPETPGETVADPSTGQFRAMQLFEVQQSGVALPIDKMQRLPGGVIFAYAPGTGLSSLIDKGTAGAPTQASADQTAPRLPRGVDMNYEYVSFRFQQDGSTNKNPTGKWFITLISINDKLAASDKPPPNFFTVQIDPVSGVTKTYRPTAG